MPTSPTLTPPASVLVIGGAVVDVVYQSANPQTAAASMYATSTPCRLARVGCGGVGRNIAEAMGRLLCADSDGEEDRSESGPLGSDASAYKKSGGHTVHLRTIVGGGLSSQQQSAPSSSSAPQAGSTSSYPSKAAAGAAPVPDGNGALVLAQLAQLAGGKRKKKKKNRQLLPAASGNSNQSKGAAPPASLSQGFGYSCAVVVGAPTATYVATLDGRGELASAAAVMGIFDACHFTPRVAMAGTALLDSLNSLNKGEDDGKEGGVFSSPLPPFIRSPQPAAEACPAKDDNNDIGRNDVSGLGVGGGGARWVVLDGNVPQTTLEAVCNRVAALNNASANAAVDAPSNGSGNHSRRQPIRIAYDPISKEKVLRALRVLPFISVMKPNELEAIALATALACGAMGMVGNAQKNGTSSYVAAIAPTMPAAVPNTAASSNPSVPAVASATPAVPSIAKHTTLLQTLVVNIRAALRGWARRHGGGSSIARIGEEDEKVKEVGAAASEEAEEEGAGTAVSAPKTHLIHYQRSSEHDGVTDATFAGIVALCIGAARRIPSSNTSVTSGKTGAEDSPYPAASAALWAAYEGLSAVERRLLALVASIDIVAIGGARHVLCTLGAGGCWSVASSQRDLFVTCKANVSRGTDSVRKGDEINAKACIAVAVRRLRSARIPRGMLVKVTGAGDSFLSGYLFGLIAGAGGGEDGNAGGTDGISTPLFSSPFAERCASLAAASALVSASSTIHPRIREFVVGDGFAVACAAPAKLPLIPSRL